MMRIMRGTGLKGLAGIDFIRADGVVIRPVLDLSRDEIELYCKENGLHPRIDSTNKEAIYTRNKIRLELLPMMREKFNPNIVDALVRLSAQAREDEDFIMSEALEYADGAVPRAHARWDQAESSLILDGFTELHSAVAKRVIMLCASRAGMEQNMSAVNLGSALRLAEDGAEGKETDLADGFYARVSYGKLWVLRRARKVRDGAGRVGGEARGSGERRACGAAAAAGADVGAAEAAALPVPELEKTGSASIVFRGREIRMHVAPAPAAASDTAACRKGGRGNMTPGGVADMPQRSVLLNLDFDLIKAKEHVVVRNRMPGDRISPLGMKGSKKLQDYFVDRRIPKHMRDDVLLIVSGGRVIAAGSEVSSECPVNTETKLILSIEY